MQTRQMTPAPDTQPQPPTCDLDRARLEGELDALKAFRWALGECRTVGDADRLIVRMIGAKQSRLARNPKGAST